MSIMRRVRDITVATLNERLEKAEDPVKLIDQFLWATREDIIQAERLYQQYAAHSQHLKAQLLQAEQQKEKREQQAITALKAGEENLARIALYEKAASEERAAQYRELYEQSRLNTSELEEQLAKLRSEYQTVYDKREYYVARMESLRLQRRMNERFSAIYGSDLSKPEGMFRALEDRITDLELETQSLSELRRIRGETFTRTDANRQSVVSAVEHELEQLKRKLEKGGPSTS